MSSLLRKRIVDADRAKLAFVSQISHELRTPLHGIGSQVELIRAVCPPSLEAIEPLLSVADVCVASLREVLDNTLEHSKMQHSVHDESFRPPALTEVDLENLVEEVVKSCWSRGRQRATAMGERVRGDVAILLDVQLSSGRFAAVDVGGLKRVLFNIIGNSLKVRTLQALGLNAEVVADSHAFADLLQFTDEGSVTITVEELHEVEGVAITVADTGRGMSGETVAAMSPVRRPTLTPPLPQNPSSRRSSSCHSDKPMLSARALASESASRMPSSAA